MHETLQQRLKRAREDAGLTQAEVARKVGISQPTYWALENKPDTGSKHLRKVADAIGVRVRWLDTGEGPRYKGELELSQAEEDIILIFRKFPAPSQKMMVAQLKAALSASLDDEPPGA